MNDDYHPQKPINEKNVNSKENYLLLFKKCNIARLGRQILNMSEGNNCIGCGKPCKNLLQHLNKSRDKRCKEHYDVESLREEM